MDDVITFIDLIWPIIISILLIVIQFLICSKDNYKSNISINLGIINIDTKITNIIILRVVLVISSLVLFFLPSVRDYSKYFPSYYKMEVFFDNYGIKHSLSEFSKKELDFLSVKLDWESDKNTYIENVNSYIYRELGIPSYFGFGSSYVHSEGYTTFYVSKLKGWQKYHIYSSSGKLDHILEAPGMNTKKFESEFLLLETANNFIDVSISEIYLSFKKIIRPVFKQIISFSPTKKQYHHTLVAVTKIRLFPVIDIGRTVYFINVNDGLLVPVAYCIYQPQ